MTRRVPNEWFSLCTTKSPACPTVPHFALSSAAGRCSFSFFNLFRFTCSPCLFVLLSLIFCHSLVTDQRSLAHPSGQNNLYRFFHHASPVARTFVFASSSSPIFIPSFLLVFFLCARAKTHACIGNFLNDPHANFRAYLIHCRECETLVYKYLYLRF